MSDGPGYWNTPVFGEKLYFDGALLNAGAGLIPVSADFTPKGVVLSTLAGTDVEQVLWVGGDSPVNLNPRTMSLPIQIVEEDDYWRIHDAADRAEAVDLWFDYAITDRWYIPGNDLGETWKFSRQLPFGVVSGISQATRAPSAWFEEYDGTLTALTVVTSAPATGEIQIPDSGGWEEATTFAGDADAAIYKWLKIRYHPILRMKILNLQFEYQEHNSLVFTLDLHEHRGGLYTPAPGVLP